jgi:hypothetical protein
MKPETLNSATGQAESVFKAIRGREPNTSNRDDEGLVETFRNAFLIENLGAKILQPNPSADPVELFKQRLKDKAIAQLEENRQLIQQAQAKYQNDPGNAALSRLRQVVEADERLEATQKRLENDCNVLDTRLMAGGVVERAEMPVPEGGLPTAQLQAQLKQTQAQLAEIKQVRRTLLDLYPASGLLNVGDVQDGNNDTELLATLNERFDSIYLDIGNVAQGIDTGDIPLLKLDALVQTTLTETPPAEQATVTEYIKSESEREIQIQLGGFLGQLGLTALAFFSGGFVGIVIAGIATALGIGQAAYEFEEVIDLNNVAKTGKAGGNQLLSDPDAAQFDYIMGWVNLVLAGIDGVLVVREGAKILKGARAAERLARQSNAQILTRIPSEKLLRLQEVVRLEKAGDASAQSLLASLRSELGEDFESAYKLFKEDGLEVLDYAEAQRIRGGTSDSLQPIFAPDGSQIPQNGQFLNLYPNDQPNPLERFELLNVNGEWKIDVNGQLETPQEGAYTFVTQNGKIYVGDGRKPYHIDLSRGNTVDYAGELRLGNVDDTIQVTEWSNSSGHYKPGAAFNNQAGLPVNVFRDASQWFIF